MLPAPQVVRKSRQAQRPDLSADGTKWMALYSSSWGGGVAGFGDAPAEAARDFDRAFQEDLTPAARQLHEREGEDGSQPPG